MQHLDYTLKRNPAGEFLCRVSNCERRCDTYWNKNNYLVPLCERCHRAARRLPLHQVYKMLRDYGDVDVTDEIAQKLEDDACAPFGEKDE